MANDRPVSMKTKEYRKVVKPLLERRRRARINGCLNELRNFILEATKQDSVQASKLEKADILEMTVHYLRLLLRKQCTMSSRTNVTDLSRFRAGFTECAHEVSLFAANMASLNPTVRGRLLTHLSECLNQLECVGTTLAVPKPAAPLHTTETSTYASRVPLPPPPTYTHPGTEVATTTPTSPSSYPLPPLIHPVPNGGAPREDHRRHPTAARWRAAEDDSACTDCTWHVPHPREGAPQRLPAATTSSGQCSKPTVPKPISHQSCTTLSPSNNAILVTVVDEDHHHHYQHHQGAVWRPW